MYPGIRTWLSKKVLPGLRSLERVGFVGYEGEEPVVSALIKISRHTKFCHLKIRNSFQDLHLGETFFALMALEVRHLAEEIHFTLPESLWEREAAFFKSFGFERVVTAGTQYRLFDRELRCAAPFPVVWSAVLNKLPKLKSMYTVAGRSMDNSLLMSIRPENAVRILGGTKTAEIRRRFSEKWTGVNVSMYASDPVKAIVGEMTINRVVCGHPTRLWERYGVAAGCSKQEYDEYVSGSEEVSFVFLEDVRPYSSPVRLTEINTLLDGEVRPPQSYCSVVPERPWGKAVALAALLHGNLSPNASPWAGIAGSKGKTAQRTDCGSNRRVGGASGHSHARVINPV
jgi:predicted transcriptional regulator